MQTMTVKIHESFMDEFIDFAKSHSDMIELSLDDKLSDDSYFYERQKKLHQIKADITNGKSNLITLEQLEERVSKTEKELELKYGN
ncbi:MAG: hypothetical protein ACLFQJ_08775 [Campylobacterales bacterium]